MVIINRPDTTFAILKLSRFFLNLNPIHMQAVNKVISYL